MEKSSTNSDLIVPHEEVVKNANVNEYEKLQCVDVFFLFKEETLRSKAGWPNCIGDYLDCGRPVLLNPVG